MGYIVSESALSGLRFSGMMRRPGAETVVDSSSERVQVSIAGRSAWA